MRKSKLKDLKLEEFDKALESRTKIVNEELCKQIKDLFNLTVEKSRLTKSEKKVSPRGFKKQLAEYIRLKPVDTQAKIEEIETKLKSYESFLDKKYWELYPLFFIRYYAEKGYVQTIEQAIALYEQRAKILDE